MPLQPVLPLLEVILRCLSGLKKEVLKWAVKQGCPLSGDCCAFAAKNGRIGILRWLRDQNCPWDGETTHVAAFDVNAMMSWTKTVYLAGVLELHVHLEWWPPFSQSPRRQGSRVKQHI